MLTPEQVVAALVRPHPLSLAVAQVRVPQFQAALAEFDIDDDPCEQVLFATVWEETAHTFEPQHERWPKGETPEQYFAMYAPPDHRAVELGNHSIEEAVLYRGRGDIQLTGLGLYTRCGIALGLDLVGNPEQLLDPVKSARAAAWYFKQKGLDALAREWNLPGCRRAVNGGLNGFEDFAATANALRQAA